MADITRWNPFFRFMRNVFDDDRGLPAHPYHHHHHHVFLRDDIDFAPSLDLKQDEKGVEITVDLPGMEKKDVEISVEDGMLVISGEKEETKREELEGYIHAERSYGRFERSVHLPEGVEEDKLKAELKNGVLKLTAPVRSVAKPAGKKVAIT
jgi:HSP20 family protein